MRAKIVALLTAVAVIALTAGGAAALPADELAPEDDTENATVGICVVGVDSPCNGDAADGSTGDQVGSNDSDDGQLWIPEDQNRDGEIDERFRGEDNGTEIGDGEDTEDKQILLPEDQNHDGEIDEQFRGDTGAEEGDSEHRHADADDHRHDNTDEKHEHGTAEDGQLWIPEDQNRDGEIDERFRGVPEFLNELFATLFGLN
ncbi:hypothetical protein [Halovenus halobia]|uniref:hypothetical protein n=1 Tax=Halovenus halobia TaxID=3396622 RepID=UPI003F543F1A